MLEDRIYNFGAGPSMLADEVLLDIQQNLLNYQGTGASVMEMSHRSKMYLDIFEETKADLIELLNISDDYEVLFIQGGATNMFTVVPLNFKVTGVADYIKTGSFSSKAGKEAEKFTKVTVPYDGKDNNYTHIPTQEELVLNPEADYVHYCANNTIYGTEWHYVPDVNGKDLICDMSSDILSKPIDVTKYALIYAGAQKNMGIAGLAVAIVKKDKLKHVDGIPVLNELDTQLKNDSMYNTPPTFAIYVLGCVMKWLSNLGGLEAINKIDEEKARLLYEVLDGSSFYKPVAEKDSRSIMNVTFTTPSKELDDKLAKEATDRGMINQKGHRSVGGIRASIYNAVPMEAVETLVEFMKEFELENK